jgi:phosphoglycerate transport regulatory protein PgtC
MKRKIFQMGLIAALTFSGMAYAGTVTVVTSFPKELTAAYKKAFEAKHPTIQLEILNKNTAAALAYIRELPVGQRPDVMWVSDPSAFEVLSREKLLTTAPEVKNPRTPAKIGNYPINDPEGLYYGQALAGYGLMWNTRYMQANKLSAPKEWADLVRPEYFGHVAISSPSRSGTTHLTVETILQGEGWNKGWGQLLQIMGNTAAVTDRSFGVPDGVNNGQFGVGLVIDFFGLAGKYSGFPVEFVYPTMTAVVPANIGLITGAKNASEAKTFMAYTLSDEGQDLLFDPAISRLPVVPYGPGTSMKAPANYPNIQEVAKSAKVKFDSNLSEQRRAIVVSMFDQVVTFRLKDLQLATKAIHDAERKLAGKSNAAAADLIRQAKALAYSPILTEAEVKNPELLELFRKSRKDVEVSKRISALEEQWGSKAKENYAKAQALANQAAAAIR